MGFITQEGLKQLSQYKYVGGAYSFFDNFLNKYWWNQIIKLMPMVCFISHYHFSP